MPTTTGTATSFIDFTRASNATVTDSDGKVKWAPHNLLLASESFDAAAWTKTTVTPTANSIAAPNGTTTADTLAASGANGTALQTFTAEAISYTFGVWLKRKTGTGNIQIAADSGTYTTVTITSDWALYTVTQTPAAGSKSAGIRIVTSADEVYAWGASLYRSDLGGMQPNTSAYPMYNPTTPKNLLGYTQDFNNAYWLKYAVAVPATKYADPFGGTTANLLYPTSATTDACLYKGGFPSVSKTHSYYVKSAGKSWFCILKEGTTGGAAWFNLSTGSVGTVAAGYTAPPPTSLGNGWYRCSVTSTSGFSQYTAISAVDADNSTTPTPNGTDGIYLWGAQLSDSASLDSYSPVYGAAVTSAAYYGPRRDFDGATLACKGLLVEEQRSNLQLNSNVFGASTFAATVVAGAAASPSGLIDASSLACTSTSGRAILSTSVTSGVVYTFSVFIKAGTNTSAYIELAGTSGSGGQVVFNLSNGTVTSGTGGAIVPAPNGFYRCSVTSTATGTGASDMRIGTGDATSKTVFVYGAQLEQNASFATSYIPTGAATATRNADVASVSTQAFPYSATEGTLVVNASSPCIAAIANMITLDNGTTQERIRLLTDVASVKTIVTESNTTQANLSPGSATANIPFKFAVAYKVNDFAAVVNGSAAATDAAGNVPVVNIARLGADNSGNYLNGHIRQITYLPRRISDTELQTRTA